MERYYVNDNKALILLMDSLYLVDKSKIEEFIFWLLCKNFELWIAFLVKLNIYDKKKVKYYT